jgi:hypothetical protein
MSQQELRCYDYVNRPYAAVRDALDADAAGLFARATSAAAARAEVVATQLRVQLGAIAVATDVVVRLTSTQTVRSPLHSLATCFALEWHSLRHPGWFPAMHASLTVYALSSYETQLVFEGHYDPPLGLLGDALDALMGRRIAEVSVLRFVQEVAAQLSLELAAARP